MSRIWQNGVDYVTISENIFVKEKENKIEFFLNEKNLGASIRDKIEMLEKLQQKVLNNSDNTAMLDMSFVPCGVLILQMTPFLKKEKRRKVVNMIIDELTKKKEEMKNGEKEEKKEVKKSETPKENKIDNEVEKLQKNEVQDSEIKTIKTKKEPVEKLTNEEVKIKLNNEIKEIEGTYTP